MAYIRVTPLEDPEVDGYATEEGGTVKREDGVSPNGNPFRRRWVYRNALGVYIDHDQYRNDLFEHNRLRLT